MQYSEFMMIRCAEDLPPHVAASLSREERAFMESLHARGLLPFGVSPYFAALAGPEADDPIRRQCVPDPREAAAAGNSFAREDPLGEALYRKTPRLIHQYANRALLLAGGGCALYCRHCFRRVRQGADWRFITSAELPPVLAYLKNHPEIQEVLVSGGDPLASGERAVEALFRRLREARPGLLLRLCTRVPVSDPERLSPGFLDVLLRCRPLRAAVHVNHPRELAGPARRVLGSWSKADIPVLVQTVLLRGINDRAETLAALFRECAGLGLRPYYLFQLDLAPGTAHFRVPLRRGIALFRELEALLPPSELPVYAVDLPGGGGKVPLNEGVIAGEREEAGGRVLLLRGPDGRLWPYPADD